MGEHHLTRWWTTLWCSCGWCIYGWCRRCRAEGGDKVIGAWVQHSLHYQAIPYSLPHCCSTCIVKDRKAEEERNLLPIEEVCYQSLRSLILKEASGFRSRAS